MRTDKSERDAKEESQLDVHGFDEAVGQALFTQGIDLSPKTPPCDTFDVGGLFQMEN